MDYYAKSPAGYPYPDTKSVIHSNDEEQYHTARLVWRSSLTDAIVRSMAADYRMGKHTEDNFDAMQEFEARNLKAQQTTNPNARWSKKKTPSRRGRKNRG